MHVYQKSINDELFKLKWSYAERKFIPDKSCHHAFHLENILVKFTIIFIIENTEYNFNLFEVLSNWIHFQINLRQSSRLAGWTQYNVV